MIRGLVNFYSWKELERMAGVGDKVKRGLAVLRSFIGALKVTVDDITYGLDIDPEKGTADSGDLEIDLPSLFVAIGEAAENRNSAVAILIDEVQYFIVTRQPFPGPGLAVRVAGEVTEERLTILRAADRVVREVIEASEVAQRLWQWFAVLVPVKTVGVMGDERTYENVVAVRAVESSDGMTCDWADLGKPLLARLSGRIINEVRGVNRVVYDISSKPPATIEWE